MRHCIRFLALAAILTGFEWPRAVYSCHVYDGIALIQSDDPNQVGASIHRRKVAAGAAVETVCGAPLGAGDVKLDAYGYVWGVVGKHVFVKGADSFGTVTVFQVFDAATGKQVYEGEGDLDGFTAKVEGGKTALRFAHQLTAPCPLAKDGETCWKKILAVNAVPAAAKVPMPDCRPAYERAKSPLDNPPLVTLAARITDVDRPSLVFEGSVAACDPSP